MVTGTACSSVVAIMNFTYGGGSSIDFSSASNAFFDRRWTSSMMKILNRSRIGAIDSGSTMTSRTASTPV